MGQVYFTDRAREDPASFSELRERVAADLREGLLDPATGERLISEILVGDKIYSGPHAAEGPDLFLVMDDWRAIAYPLLSSGPDLVTPHIQKNRCGNHRINGMFCASGPSFRRNGRQAECSITDVAPTVLYLQGVRASTAMDGQVLRSTIQEPVLAQRDAATPVAASARAAGAGGRLTEEEERERKDRLQGLGYL
jgi:predicted AlkP superfamily phosphohydrolase/phosphomutase